MRTRSLLILSALAALAVPATSNAAGGTYQVTETVTIEADVAAPLQSHLVATLRTRRVVAVNADPAVPGQPFAGSLEERSISVSLTHTAGEFAGQLVCFTNASKASMDVTSEDATSLKVTDASCPMELSTTGNGNQAPFARSVTTGGPGRDNGFESGYTRGALVQAAKLFGDDAFVTNVKYSRTTRVSAVPVTGAGTPTPPAPPTAPDVPPLPEAPPPPSLPQPEPVWIPGVGWVSPPTP